MIVFENNWVGGLVRKNRTWLLERRSDAWGRYIVTCIIKIINSSKKVRSRDRTSQLPSSVKFVFHLPLLPISRSKSWSERIHQQPNLQNHWSHPGYEHSMELEDFQVQFFPRKQPRLIGRSAIETARCIRNAAVWLFFNLLVTSNVFVMQKFPWMKHSRSWASSYNMVWSVHLMANAWAEEHELSSANSI